MRRSRGEPAALCSQRREQKRDSLEQAGVKRGAERQAHLGSLLGLNPSRTGERLGCAPRLHRYWIVCISF